MERQPIDHRIVLATDQGVKLIAALQEKIASLNLPGEAITIPPFVAAHFTLEQDPCNGDQTLRASFFPTQFYCNGFLLFHSDGSCFAEYHVMQLHPIRSSKRWKPGCATAGFRPTCAWLPCRNNL